MRVIWLCVLMGLASVAHANSTGLDGLLAQNQEQLSPALKVFGALTLLSLAPSLLMMLTSYTRIVIVLSLLRSALGLQQSPPNSVLISLALFLTALSMYGVGLEIYQNAYLPYERHALSTNEALQRTLAPIKAFMLKQTRERELAMIWQTTNTPPASTQEEVQMVHLMPAFMLSELETAFEIGFMVFLPFLLVDLIVSAILMTMGMMMMPPATLSLPIKILLFVLIDGFSLVSEALITSFN